MSHGVRRWSVVVLLIGIAFMLGLTGFRKAFAASGQPHDAGDAIYLALQLFFLESGLVEGTINTELQVARFLAPVASAYAVIQAAVVIFSLQVQRIWLRLFGRHVIVCGLGEKGVRLVEQLRKDRKRVVVIEPDEQNHDLSHCRGVGATVLAGRADDSWTLRKAVLPRAATLISVAGDDGVNIETAVRAHALNRSRGGSALRCVIHISDPDLQMILKQHAIFAQQDDPFELAFFNVFETASRVMLREPPTLSAPLATDRASTHVIVVGFGRMGKSLVSRLVRDWRIDHPDVDVKLRITVVDLATRQKKEAFHLRHPEFASDAIIEFIPTDVRSASFSKGAFLDSQADVKTVAAAYVCLGDDSLAALAALTMRRWLDDAVPIVVRMSQEAGIATLLETTRGGGIISGVRAVGLLDIACNLDAVLGGTTEVLAQAIHQGYIQDQMALGEIAAQNPSLRPWRELPADLQHSNRAQAADIDTKLQAVGCEKVWKTSGRIDVLAFSEAEVEQLAEMEHARFVSERLAAGWKLSPPDQGKDIDNKLSPYLIPWSDERLPEDVKDNDRNAVRRLPAILAKADFELRRID